MQNQIPKIALLQDLVGFGRAALAVMTPVISVCGAQACGVPTAVLSTHGGYENPAIIDLSNYIKEAQQHYKKLDLHFDAVCTGFLSDPKQIATCIDFLADNANAIKIVDPIMGDHGAPYKIYKPALISKMKELVRFADILTPNTTELALLTDEPYADVTPLPQLTRTLQKLAGGTHARLIIVTGVHLGENKNANVIYDCSADKITAIPFERLPQNFPGTGDIFTSILASKLVFGETVEVATKTAADFLNHVIALTLEAGSNPLEGVLLERGLPWLFSH